MNKILFSFISISIFITTLLINNESRSIKNYQQLIGQWSSEDRSRKVIIDFLPNYKCNLSVFTSIDTTILTGDVYLDLKKKPVTFSIVKIPNLNHPLHSILSKLNKDHLVVSKFSKNWRLRPINFTNDAKIILKRTKKG